PGGVSVSRSTRRTPAALAALALAAGLVAATPASAADRARPSGDTTPVATERFVALGDSFVSGPGIPQQLDGCYRSDKNFVRLVAADLKISSFTDASCSAARATHYWNPQTLGGYTNPAQLDAVDRGTTLVTMGTMG